MTGAFYIIPRQKNLNTDDVVEIYGKEGYTYSFIVAVWFLHNIAFNKSVYR